MYPRQPARWPPEGGGFAGGPPAPRPLLYLLGFIFVTFTLQFFATTKPWLALLRLTPAVWEAGFVWQLLTYGFVGFGQPDFWILLQLLMLFFFGRDVYGELGRIRFWKLLAYGALTASVVAVLVELLAGSAGWFPERLPFMLIQGQQILLVILVAAFAVLRRNAVILLMFVLPVKARWFLPLEILLGFLGFLWSKDLAGFLGLSAAVGITWWLLQPTSLRRLLREARLRLEQRWLKLRMAGLRRRRGFKSLDGGKAGSGTDRGNGKLHKGPWVN